MKIKEHDLAAPIYRNNDDGMVDVGYSYDEYDEADDKEEKTAEEIKEDIKKKAEKPEVKEKGFLEKLDGWFTKENVEKISFTANEVLETIDKGGEVFYKLKSGVYVDADGNKVEAGDDEDLAKPNYKKIGIIAGGVFILAIATMLILKNKSSN